MSQLEHDVTSGQESDVLTVRPPGPEVTLNRGHDMAVMKDRI
ncbi:MAG TPA: hypothetical protein PLE81_12140 [Brevundimonas sp.]|nr:hypothetical protein [Brevundimonas sp.]HRH21373.1 hypothetical protein [Brevundimonas sp.]